jgi:ADP-ribose pyrophosphatase YjhB (NUDIX family)
MDKKKYVGVVVKCKDEVLLCKRNHDGSFPGMWSIPAGKLEDNESTHECAVREFYEETSLMIPQEKLKFIGLIPRHTRDGKKVKGLMYVYQINVDKKLEPDFEKAKDGEEHSEWAYFRFKDIRMENTGTKLYELLKIVLNKN